MQLARLETWGKANAETAAASATKSNSEKQPEVKYKSYREIVTPTGTLSNSETEIIDCFESIQSYYLGRFLSQSDKVPLKKTLTNETKRFENCRIKAGPPLTEHDGRTAFLLAFASAIEIEVLGEVVSAMFCGDRNEPLLVQRIGKARNEGKELATAGGATSGAMAVPSLGYVQRNRSREERKLIEAAEVAVAEHWIGGKTGPLPLLPPGYQWESFVDESVFQCGWDEEEPLIERTASFSDVDLSLIHI